MLNEFMFAHTAFVDAIRAELASAKAKYDESYHQNQPHHVDGLALCVGVSSISVLR